MEEKELEFDRKKHICYSKAVKRAIISRLHDKFKTEEEVNQIWKKIQLKYVDFLKDQTYLGGKKCTHNGAGGTYDCILIFAYYEILDPKPTLDELYDINLEIFLPPFKRVGKIVNMNKKPFAKIMHKAFCMASNGDKKIEKECPTGYLMDVEPLDQEKGIHYKFHRCPIAEFAKEHGYLNIMPALCNADYPGLKAMHATLIRQYTCSNHNYCDYWIVGDESEYAKKYPMIIDEKGYMKNIIKEEE